jgi:chromosome segregation ATPase
MMGLTNLSSRDCGGPSVFHWFSPFPLEPSLEERLGAAGLRPVAANGEVSIDLLLYDTPDAVLNRWRQRGQSAPSTQALAEGYRRLSQLRDGTRLISTWRLHQLNADELLAWLHGQADCPTLETPPPAMDALSAVVTRRLLELQADALEAYLDLELQAELAGTRPDSNYIARLDNNADGATLLEDWWQMAEQAATANQLTGEVAQLSAEMEVLAQEKNAALQGACVLREQLGSQAESLVEVQEENQATLQQLHQVQEELESYFLRNREQDEQLQKLEAQLTQLRREQAAISQARDAALEASADLNQQLATQTEALHLAQAKGEQQAGHLQVLEADAARWKEKAETAGQQHTAARQQVIDLEQQLASQSKTLVEAQGESQSTLLQLHQVQEELETYFLTNREQDEQLQTLERQLTQLRREQAATSQARDAALKASADLKDQLAAQREAFHLAQAKGEQQAGHLQVLEADVARWKTNAETASQQHTAATQQVIDLEQQLATQAKTLVEAQEESQSTLLQLHQVQEELEHYFLRARAGDELCQAQAQENTRAMGLLGRMIRLQAGL